MRKQKKDILTEEDFTKLNRQNSGKGTTDDENNDMLEETLIGMEYDLEPEENEWDEDEEEDREYEKESQRNEDHA